MYVFKKLFEIFQKYDPFFIVVHFVQDGINYVVPGYVCTSLYLYGNDDVIRIQKKGYYRHVYLRKED